MRLAIKNLEALTSSQDQLWADSGGALFLKLAHLELLESSGSVSEATGWIPKHIFCETSQGQIYLPGYLKFHSYGEYVFDFQWSDAYRSLGRQYYPKWVSTYALNSSVGTKIQSTRALSGDSKVAALIELRDLVLGDTPSVSSFHHLFLPDQELDLYRDSGHFIRHGIQYHWHNRGYVSFEDFLSALHSKKRKDIRRERRVVQSWTDSRSTTPPSRGLAFEIKRGSDLSPQETQWLFQFYLATVDKRGGNVYLSPEYFEGLPKVFPDSLFVFFACLEGRPIGVSTLFVDFGSQVAFGRWWGTTRSDIPFLHFELCYYRPIEFCIENQIQTYQAGAQGEHKLLRGFSPVLTFSAHWIYDDRLGPAIERYVLEENRSVQRTLELLDEKYNPIKT